MMQAFSETCQCCVSGNNMVTCLITILYAFYHKKVNVKLCDLLQACQAVAHVFCSHLNSRVHSTGAVEPKPGENVIVYECSMHLFWSAQSLVQMSLCMYCLGNTSLASTAFSGRFLT